MREVLVLLVADCKEMCIAIGAELDLNYGCLLFFLIGFDFILFLLFRVCYHHADINLLSKLVVILMI